MQTIPQQTGAGTDSGFEPIPTRIKDLPPLIVNNEDPAVTEQVTSHLHDLQQRLAVVHRSAAEAYLAQGMYEQALPHAQAAVTFGPEAAEYHNQLGFICYMLGDDASAIACFDRVLSMQPDQPDALFNLGMTRFGRADFQTAHDCFRRSLDARPSDAEAWNNLGVCLHQLGRLADARAHFERALQIDAANEDARANLASIA